MSRFSSSRCLFEPHGELDDVTNVPFRQPIVNEEFSPIYRVFGSRETVASWLPMRFEIFSNGISCSW